MATKRVLYLYKDTSPNKDGGKHFAVQNESVYVLTVGTQLKHLDENSYRIINGVCKVAGEALEATYIIDEGYDDVTFAVKYWRCYYVTGSEYVSGYTVLYLKTDLWGSYIFGAKITNGLVARCNRNIGLGQYDEIGETAWQKGDADILKNIVPLGGTSESGVSWWEDENVVMVFFASCVLAENIAKTETTTQIIPFGLPLSDLRALFELGTMGPEVLKKYGIAELATQVVSGFNSIATTSWLKTNDVQIQKMFFLPAEAVNFDEWGFTFNSKCKAMEDASLTSLAVTCKALKPSFLRKIFPFEPTGNDVNFKWFAGVHDNGIELSNFTGSTVIEYDFSINHDGVQVTVMQGDNMKDLTSQFQVSIIGNSQQNDALQNISYWGKYFTNLIGTVLKNATSQNYHYRQVAATSSYISGLFSQLGKKSTASGTIGNGDGSVTFDWSRKYDEPSYVNYPFYLIKYKSVIDERQNARYNGANYSVHLSDGKVIDALTHIKENNDLLGSGTLEDTYIKLDCCVTGVPLDACNYIEEKLRKGVYY